MDGDINNLRTTLAGYKATVTIALGGANLRTSVMNMQLLDEYSNMIRDTTIDLQENLRDLNERVGSMSVQLQHSTPNTERQIFDEDSSAQEEKEGILQCLRICADVSEYIGKHQQEMLQSGLPGSSSVPKLMRAETITARQATADTLQQCSDSLTNTHVRLRARLDYLKSGQLSSEGSSENSRIQEELESIQYCLNICEQATANAEQKRTNVMEDVVPSEDSQQILVSTIGELITARRVTAGARSTQCLGQMSDESIQQISKVHGSFVAKTSGEFRSRDSNFETQYGAGRKAWDNAG